MKILFLYSMFLWLNNGISFKNIKTLFSKSNSNININKNININTNAFLLKNNKNDFYHFGTFPRLEEPNNNGELNDTY